MQSPARVVQMTTRGRFDPNPDGRRSNTALGVPGWPWTTALRYIADGGNRRIVVFNDRGEFRRTIALTYNPGRLAIGPRRSLYVTDPGSDHIRVHSNRGTLVNDVSFPGGARGMAVNLTVTPPLVYLALAGNARVAEYDLAFTPRRFLTQVGQGVGQTVAPEKIAVDCRGSLYITSFGGGGVAGAAGPSKVIKFADPASKPPPCTPAAPLTEPVDAQVNDVEVTQGVQWPRDFTATDSPAGPRTRAYGGPDTEVPLRVDGKTVVRVYANLHSGDLGGVTNVPATLEGVGQFGKRFGPIAPDSVPAVLRLGGTTVDAAQRADEAGAYTFTLPLDWTRAGRLELTARVNPAGLGCADACVRRSTFKLTGVPFRNTVRGCGVGGTGGRPRPACDNVYGVDIDPVALTSGGRYPQLPNGSTLNDPGPIFDVARTLTPAELLVRGWGAEIEIGDLLTASAITTSSCFLGIQLGITCSEDTENLAVGSDRTRELLQPMLLDRVQRYKASRNIGDARIVIGLRGGNERNAVSLPGAMRGKFLEGGFPPIEFVGPRGYVDVSRPYTAVAQ